MDSNRWTNFFRIFLPGSLIWRGDITGKNVYLTFDDGPSGPFTHEILDILDAVNARATFFCVGDNVRRYPDSYEEILRRGHRTGNHTFYHLKGWKTKLNQYVSDVYEAAHLIRSDLFRPPYGKISYLQINRLKKDFKIVMWSVLSMDYDPSFSAEKCLEIVNRNTSNGKIVVFHDSIKAEAKVRYILPRYLAKLKEEGYLFKTF